MKNATAYEVPIPISELTMSSEVKSIQYSRQNDSQDDVEEDYWENLDFEDQGAFDIFDELNDEAEL